MRRGEASYRRPALIAAGHIRSFCPRVSEAGRCYKEIHEFCADLTLCSRGHCSMRRSVVSRLLLRGS